MTAPRSEVALDGFPSRSLGHLTPSWRIGRPVGIGERITAAVIDVNLEQCWTRLSTAAIEFPELWAFLKACCPGEVLTGTVASIESFGVFVALDDGPAHPSFPGVGFVTHPELSWLHFAAATDVVQVGQRVSGEFLVFDTHNGEARLSLKALQPNPHENLVVGQEFRGTVTKVVPFGVFVAIAYGIEGLLHADHLDAMPLVGDEIPVTITEVDPRMPRVRLSPTASAGSPDA